MSLGTLGIYDSRRDVDIKLPITKLELRSGRLEVEASCVVDVRATAMDNDVATIYDPAGNIVCRYWISLGDVTYNLIPGYHFTLMQRIALGGARAMSAGHVSETEGSL